eukprot:TRINITY_DN3755_c0_g1_i1.p1 TRINITY_DN3755_c0_g1~~TRINITY_DN3755_c0_g1_i1.p1  ORF type:complete len:232 (+),score=53.75 TRINITY_DN3755_c0_g1_i1:90-785(+)
MISEDCFSFFFFFFKQKTAYEMLRSLVGSEMCIRDRYQRRVRGRTIAHCMEDTGEGDMTECNKHKDRALRENPMVKFMMTALQKAGCSWEVDKFKCITCSAPVEAGYDQRDEKIKICGNNVHGYNAVCVVMAHELLHAFDACRAHTDWSNLQHHACTEIRASNLSGECKWGQEVLRGMTSFQRQHQACVRRRAVLSVKMNPNCADEAAAQAAVAHVWDKCYNDPAPFDRVP